VIIKVILQNARCNNKENDKLIAIKSMNESIPVDAENLSLHWYENHEKPQDGRYFVPYSNQRPPECFPVDPKSPAKRNKSHSIYKYEFDSCFLMSKV